MVPENGALIFVADKWNLAIAISAFAWSNRALATAIHFRNYIFISTLVFCTSISAVLYWRLLLIFSLINRRHILNNNWPSYILTFINVNFLQEPFSLISMFYRPNLRNIFFVNEVSIVIGLVTEYVSATSFLLVLSYNSLNLLGQLAQIKWWFSSW
jgi:hypothetical protein